MASHSLSFRLHSQSTKTHLPHTNLRPSINCLQRNREAAAEDRPLELFWRTQYVPHEGKFCDPLADLLQGTRLAEVGGGELQILLAHAP